MRRCIVNVAFGKWYPRGQARLRQTLSNVGYDEDTLFWTDDLPPGCPEHRDVPMGFKTHALEVARTRGYGATIWCDASTWFLRHPEPLFERIERDGYYLWRNPHENIGEFATDKCLAAYGVEREESFSIPSVVATMFGLDLQSDVGLEVLRRLGAAARSGVFCGPFINDPCGPEWYPGAHTAAGSTDPRVKGCRYDQTALSCIAHQMGIKMDERVPSALLGFPSMPHADSVVAMAEDDGGASMDAWEREGYLKR